MSIRVSPGGFSSVLLGCVAGMCGIGGIGAAAAAPISVSDPNGYLIASFRGQNTIGLTPGLRITYGDTSVLPNGSGGTTATASTVNLGTGKTFSAPLPFVGSPALPNQFGNSIAYDPALTGPWTLAFQNGADTRVVTTPSIQGVTAPPSPSSVTLSGSSANPTFAWAYPANSVNGVFFDIYDRSMSNAAGGAALVYSHTLAGTTNAYSVPSQLAGGLTLQLDHQYTLDLYGVVTRGGVSTLNNPNSQAWSQTFFNFTPLPAGAPVVNLATTTASGAYQFNLVVVAGQVYYLDPSVTTGYDFTTGVGDPNFASVILPAVQSGAFTVSFLENGATVSDLVAPGGTLMFPVGGVAAFRIAGIDPALGLDPSSPGSFITGVTFAGSGVFDGLQTPLFASAGSTAMPEPASLLLLGGGAFGVVLRRRRG